MDFALSGQQACIDLRVQLGLSLSTHPPFLFGPPTNKQLWGRTAIITGELKATLCEKKMRFSEHDLMASSLP